MAAHLCGRSPAPVKNEWAALPSEKIGADGASPSRLPIQNMDLALVGPCAGFGDKSCVDGIFSHISPIFRVAFFFPQLRIPKIPLPNGYVIRVGPVPCGMGFPKRDPLLQRRR